MTWNPSSDRERGHTVQHPCPRSGEMEMASLIYGLYVFIYAFLVVYLYYTECGTQSLMPGKYSSTKLYP